MKNHDLLEQVLGTAMDNDLKNEILGLILKDTTRPTNVITLLKERPDKPDSEAIYSRMTAVAGGTGANVARLLGVSSQAINNQRLRGFISGNTIINFHLKTGVSLDWLVDGRIGNVDGYGNGNRSDNQNPPAKIAKIGGFPI